MSKQVMRWKKVECKTMAGIVVMLEYPESLDSQYRGELLSRMLSMPSRAPISFNEAIQMLRMKLNQVFSDGQIGRKPGQYFWYLENFVEWISDSGFHIDITGEEFEPANQWNI